MLNYKKMILSTTLAMALIAPTAVYASPLNAVKPDSKMSVCEKKCAKDNKMNDKKMTRDCKMDEKCKMNDKKMTKECKMTEEKKCNKEGKVDTYEQTLQKAEEFVPGTTEKGEVALKNRKELKNRVKDVRKEKIQAAISPLKEEFKAEVNTIEGQATNGEITKKAAREQLMIIQHEKIVEVQDIKDKFIIENKANIDDVKVKKASVNESYNDFVLAVKSKDAKTIENTFNIYIQNSNEFDDVLSQLVTQFTA